MCNIHNDCCYTFVCFFKVLFVVFQCVNSFAFYASEVVWLWCECWYKFQLCFSKCCSKATDGCGWQLDLTWKGCAVDLLSPNMKFMRIVLENCLKSLSRDLCVFGTGGVGINFRPLDRSLTSLLARAWFERSYMNLSFWYFFTGFWNCLGWGTFEVGRETQE